MCRKKDFMILLKIFDVKDMMAHLLLAQSFDDYLLEEAAVTTFAKMEIMGRRNKEWYDLEENPEILPDHLYWKEVKPVIYAYIKGKKTPYSFSISLKAADEEAYRILGGGRADRMIAWQGMKFLLHFRFEKGTLSIVTGTFFQNFTMDKRGEFAWDSGVKKLLGQLKISYEEG